MRGRFLAQRRKAAERCRVSEGFLCAIASLRENSFFAIQPTLLAVLQKLLPLTEAMVMPRSNTHHY
jgi:hypothetical protein